MCVQISQKTPKGAFIHPANNNKKADITFFSLILSQIQAMNFASHHTVSHRSLKDYISHHPLHQHSCLHWSRTHLQTITQSPSPNHTHTHTLHKPWTFSHSLPSIVSQSTYKAFSLVSLVCFPVFRFRPCPWIILSALPTGLSLPIADPRLPKDYSSVLSMPYPFAPARPCLYWPCMWIKSLHLDPNVSRLVIPVTEYSARQDPAAFQRVIQKVWMSREICLPLSKVLDLWSNILGSSWSSLTIQICRTLYWLRFFAMALISLCNHNSDARDRGHH